MTKAKARTTYFGAALFDGFMTRADLALTVENGRIAAILPVAGRPRDGEQVDLGGGVLSPGFIDWQVNGGGGVLFTAEPTPDGIAKIAAAHRAHGTTAILPTLITDAPQVLTEGLKAAKAARGKTPGSLGIHVEGPFIDVARKGVHRPDFIRPMRPEDVAALIGAEAGTMLVTLAPNIVGLADIAVLAMAGIIVSLGHSEASPEQADAAFGAGARAVTHLFNAMSQMQGRTPGLVGAALARREIFCGIIADGQHVHPASIRAAFAAKGAGGLCLVSDAMPPAAGGADAFALQGRAIHREDGRLVDATGALAGAAITMRDAVAYCVEVLGFPLADALTMATSTPARLLGLEGEIGTLAAGARADLVHLGARAELLGVI